MPSKRRCLRRNIEVTSEDEESYSREIEFMLEECDKEKPSKRVLRRTLQNTMAKRRKWIVQDGPTVSEILEKFPPLGLGMTYVSFMC